MKASDLGSREIINVPNGQRLGAVKDIHFDEKGQIKAIVLEGRKKKLGLWGGGRDIVVPWDKVRTIGTDVVLVDMKPEEPS
jgi:YlmC/YmxH family sporulation protein